MYLSALPNRLLPKVLLGLLLGGAALMSLNGWFADEFYAPLVTAQSLGWSLRLFGIAFVELRSSPLSTAVPSYFSRYGIDRAWRDIRCARPGRARYRGVSPEIADYTKKRTRQEKPDRVELYAFK